MHAHAHAHAVSTSQLSLQASQAPASALVLCLDDESGGELKLSDMAFFIDEGIGKLLLAMLRQSLRDILEDRKNTNASADISTSARWPSTPTGMACIEFLMPSASPDRVVAFIYKQPEYLLNVIESTQKNFENDPVENDDEYASATPASDCVPQ